MRNLNRRDVPHYTAGGIESLDVIRAKSSPEMFQGFLYGNVLKYMMRYRLKGTPKQDLQKAQTYLGWLIEEQK